MAAGYAFAGSCVSSLSSPSLRNRIVPHGDSTPLWPFGRTIERADGGRDVGDPATHPLDRARRLVVGDRAYVVTGPHCARRHRYPLGIASFKMVPVSLVP